VAPVSDGGICCEASQPGALPNLRERLNPDAVGQGPRNSSFRGPLMLSAVVAMCTRRLCRSRALLCLTTLAWAPTPARAKLPTSTAHSGNQ
jgi:hypothetical protein